jgi:integrase
VADITPRVSERTGKTTYQARVRRAGHEPLIKTFKTKAQADAWARTQEKEMLDGKPILTKEKERYTFGIAIDDYAEHVGYDSPTEKYRFGQIREDMGDLAVVNLTAEKLSKYIKVWQKTLKPEPKNKKKQSDQKKEPVQYAASTVRKVYFSVKKLHKWHSGFKGYPVNDIFDIVKAPTNDVERNRRLVGDEEQRILAACDKSRANKEELKTVFLVSLETAMRLGEMLKIEWSHVDFEHCSIKVPLNITKTKKYREVPMTTVCVKLLKEHLKTKNPKNPRVFWQWKDSHTFNQRFNVVRENAKMEDYRFHDNRHEATSRFFERTTLRDTEIAKITGHASMVTLMRYANLRTNDLAKKLW